VPRIALLVERRQQGLSSAIVLSKMKCGAFESLGSACCDDDDCEPK